VPRKIAEHADRDHRRLQRIDITRDDRLQLVDHLCADQDRIDGKMRPRGVSAFTLDLNGEMVGGGHHRARTDGELADRQARIIVHAVNFLDAEALDQPVVDHGERAGAALLGRLENDHRGAGEIAGLGEIFCGAKQHRSMAVMAAGVHLARNGRLVGQAGFFFDRQRVHVGAQANDPVAGLVAGLVGGLAPANDADHAGAPNAGDYFIAAEALELLGD
jgi:hypothetical protein